MDAAIDIEQNFEEDASAIPELLMANISSQDVVIGISVSGRAFYVQSALAYAKHEGALSVMRLCITVEYWWRTNSRKHSNESWYSNEENSKFHFDNRDDSIGESSWLLYDRAGMSK